MLKERMQKFLRIVGIVLLGAVVTISLVFIREVIWSLGVPLLRSLFDATLMVLMFFAGKYTGKAIAEDRYDRYARDIDIKMEAHENYINILQKQNALLEDEVTALEAEQDPYYDQLCAQRNESALERAFGLCAEPANDNRSAMGTLETQDLKEEDFFDMLNASRKKTTEKLSPVKKPKKKAKKKAAKPKTAT